MRGRIGFLAVACSLGVAVPAQAEEASFASCSLIKGQLVVQLASPSGGTTGVDIALLRSGDDLVVLNGSEAVACPMAGASTVSVRGTAGADSVAFWSDHPEEAIGVPVRLLLGDEFDLAYVSATGGALDARAQSATRVHITIGAWAVDLQLQVETLHLVGGYGSTDDSVDLSQLVGIWAYARLGGGNDTFIGTAGADQVDSGPGRDVVRTFGGDDRIWDGGGDRLADGTIVRDLVEPGTGDDMIDAGEAVVSYADAGGPVAADLGLGTATGADGHDLLRASGLIGSAYDDVLMGRTASIDTIDGRAGDDVIDGRGGADVVRGGKGFDQCAPYPETVDVAGCEAP